MSKKVTALAAFLLVSWAGAALMQSCLRKQYHTCSFYGRMQASALDNADSVPHEPLNGQIIAKAMILSLSVDDSFGGYCRNPFQWIPSATACTNSRDTAMLAQQLQSVVITSNHDFDAKHAAGDTLNDLFYYSATGLPLPGHTYRYYLRAAPDDTGTHIFAFHFTFDHGGSRDAYAAPVKLLK